MGLYKKETRSKGWGFGGCGWEASFMKAQVSLSESRSGKKITLKPLS
jgi:hypothetical protein